MCYFPVFNHSNHVILHGNARNTRAVENGSIGIAIGFLAGKGIEDGYNNFDEIRTCQNVDAGGGRCGCR